LLVGNDGIIQRDLAEILHLSRPQVTKIVQALEQKGVVVRRNDEDDQRLTRVYVTDEGRRRELEMRSFWEEYLEQTIGSLSEPDRVELERLLRLLSTRVSQLMEEEVQAL
jgi:DNA-binding MarR family transcriptional regulator